MNMKSKTLSKDEIYKRLREHYASEPEQVLREASYNLAMSSVSEETVLARAGRAIEKLNAYGSRSPLSAQQAQRTDLQTCPICRIAMSSVKLLEDKPAWYCADHRIVVPKPTE